MNSHPHDLLGAYTTDALDVTESAEVDTHLLECEDCAIEVASYREVLAAMAEADAVRPPADLEGVLLAAVTNAGPPEADHQAGGGGGPDGSGAAIPGGAGTSGPQALAPTDGSDAAIPATVVPLAPRRRRGRSLELAAAAVAGIALFVGGVAVGRTALPGSEPASGGDIDSLLAVASADDATYVPVDLMGTATRVFLSDEMGKMAVLASDLPIPAKGMCYQVWRVSPDGSKESAGTFTPDDQGHVAVVLDAGSDASAYVITMEPPDGSTAPTGEMVGQVSA